MKKSEVTGDSMKEAQNINQSLSSLGTVMAALQEKSKHIPFRDSKLTQLLADSLGGNSKTFMFVNISPSATSAAETRCSLDFATRVRRVELGKASGKRVEGASLQASRSFMPLPQVPVAALMFALVQEIKAVHEEKDRVHSDMLALNQKHMEQSQRLSELEREVQLGRATQLALEAELAKERSYRETEVCALRSHR